MKIPKVVSVEAWPQADRLFHSDPLWLGSDDAYSIPLSGDRVLWLFGDTFVAPRPGATRRECFFVRNSIGVQQGLDPSQASISFHWGGHGGGPGDFFEDETGWLWPLHGATVGGRVVLFFMKVRSPQAASGGIDEWIDSDSLSFFEVYGWGARLVHNPDDDPSDWKVEELTCPANDLGVVLGAGVLAEDTWLYLWGWTQERQGYLARLSIDDAAAGDFSGLRWWSRDGRWSPSPEAGEVALDQAQTEFTIYRYRGGDLFQLQAMGLTPADLTIRWAENATGPWSEVVPFFRIPESERDRVIAYAGKAHPNLAGADLVLTYASNGDAAEVTLDDDTIYFPRFLKVTLSND